MDAVVRTSAGTVRGLAGDGITTFLGIPFAAAPDGPRRFQPPTAPEPWDGVRDAVEFGTAPPQLRQVPSMPSVWEPGDGLDCLTVNVWTPDGGAANLPVMVWIYGGAWKQGAAKEADYEAGTLARSGVVVVTFNYRVGFEGFGHLPGFPDNRGLRDQVAALEWVRDNIAAFGGDPGNVTIFGESSGAASVAIHVGAPGARDLFRRAIAQSIPGSFLAPERAEKVTRILSEETGVEPTWDGFATLTPETLLRVQDVPLRGGRSGITAFGPVIDGDLVTGQPWEPIQAGAGRDIDLVCGFTHEEYRLFAAGVDASGFDLPRVATNVGLGSEAISAYQAAYPGSDNGDLFTVLMSDWLFRIPSTWVAEAHARAGGRTWLYDFTWKSPLLGACHAIDLPFTFGNADTPLATLLLGSPPPGDFDALSRQVRTSWTSFAATGDPGWSRFDLARRLTRIWDTPPRDAAYPLEDSYRIWDEHFAVG